MLQPQPDLQDDIGGFPSGDSRRYIERIWRVPKDKGAVHFFASLCVKALIKHGWPSFYLDAEDPLSFYIGYIGETRADNRLWDDLPADFTNAVAQAVAVVARQHRMQSDVSTLHGRVSIARKYTVKVGGFLAPCMTPSGSECVCYPDADFYCSRKTWGKK
jgi:hypothetical protein